MTANRVPRVRRAERQYATVGAVIVAVLLVIAVLSPWIAKHDPFALGETALAGPSANAWFGTDNLGRDVWSQFVYGARLSLTVGVVAALIGSVIGVGVGTIAGVRGGVTDALLMRLTEAVLILPRFIVAVAVVAFLGSGISRIIMVIGLMSWPGVARIVRAEVMKVKNLEFVEAARASGLGRGSIVFREILPNSLGPAIVVASLDIGQAILVEAGLSFLGLGDPTVMSWGTMLNNSQRFLAQAWWMAIFPGVGIFLSVLGFNMLGEGLRASRRGTKRARNGSAAPDAGGEVAA